MIGSAALDITATMVCGPEGIKALLIPMIDVMIPAGIPDEAVDSKVDQEALYNTLVVNPQHTYCFRAKGQSMIGAGIDSGDLVIVDRVIPRKANSIIIAEVDGKYTLKRFERENGNLFLVPANPDFQRIRVHSHQQCNAWGTVLFVIKKLY